jgi:hypothetical protein
MEEGQKNNIQRNSGQNVFHIHENYVTTMIRESMKCKLNKYKENKSKYRIIKLLNTRDIK